MTIRQISSSAASLHDMPTLACGASSVFTTTVYIIPLVNARGLPAPQAPRAGPHPRWLLLAASGESDYVPDKERKLRFFVNCPVYETLILHFGHVAVFLPFLLRISFFLCTFAAKIENIRAIEAKNNKMYTPSMNSRIHLYLLVLCFFIVCTPSNTKVSNSIFKVGVCEMSDEQWFEKMETEMRQEVLFHPEMELIIKKSSTFAAS